MTYRQRPIKFVDRDTVDGTIKRIRPDFVI